MVPKKNSVLFAKQAISYMPKGFSDDRLPPSDISPSDLPDGHRNSLSISPFTSPIATGNSTLTIQNTPTAPGQPRRLYATTGVQTTPSLIREVSPGLIERKSSSEGEGAANEKNDQNNLSFTGKQGHPEVIYATHNNLSPDGLSYGLFQTPPCHCRRRVVCESNRDEGPGRSIPSTPTPTIFERPALRIIPNIPPYWLIEAEANVTPKRPARKFTYSPVSESPIPGLEYFTRVGPPGRYPSMPKRRPQDRISPGELSGSPSVSDYEIDGSVGVAKLTQMTK
jgi:hypothetical protein